MIRGLSKDGFQAIYISVTERLANEWLDKVRVICLLEQITPVTDNFNLIVLPNGSRFYALPQNPASVRSYSPDEVYLDEFAHYQHDKKILTAIAPSLSRKDKKRVLIIGSTPFGKLGEFFRIGEDKENGYLKKTIDIYEAIRQGVPLIAEECQALCPDDDAFQQEYCCQFVDDSSSFLPYELIKQCWDVTLPLQFTFEDMSKLKDPLFAGYDPGKLVDSGVFTVVEMTKDGVIRRHEKLWNKVDYTEQLQYIIQAMKASKITKINIDRTGVGEKLFEDLKKEFGYRVNGITFTNATKEKMIIDLKVLFQNKQIKIPYDIELTNQLHSLQRILLPSKQVRYAHPSGKHDDRVWALALACMSSGDNAKPISVRYLGED